MSFVYIILYGLLFGYVTWTLSHSCGPSLFASIFSCLLSIYTAYSSIIFCGEKFFCLWIILHIFSLSSFGLGIFSSLDCCASESTQYQWFYQIYFPDIALLPWIFILGFVSMKHFFVEWKLQKLFFVFVSFNAFFIGVGMYVIAFYALEQDAEYKIIWQLAIILILFGALPCFIFVIFSFCSHCLFDGDEMADNIETFDALQPLTIWTSIQIIVSLLNLWSDICYALLSDFYSPYLQIACWIFIFFQLIPDFFVLLQIISDPQRYAENEQIIWFPSRRVLKIICSSIIFFVIGTIFILSRILPIVYVQKWLFDWNCCKIVKMPKYKKEEKEDILIDMRLHSMFLLFEVFFESIPFVIIILLNSYVLLGGMTVIGWMSLIISAYVVLKNLYMFFDDIFLSNKQRKSYYCL